MASSPTRRTPSEDGGIKIDSVASSIITTLSARDMIEVLDTLIERVLAPFAQQMSLLCTIPGIGERAAQVIISENGVDMSRFPTAAHLASWAGLCPGNNESAGKHKSGRTRKGNQEVACARWRSTCWTRQK